MKHMTRILTLGLLAATLASCNTYVEGRGHAGSGYHSHSNHPSNSGGGYSGRSSGRSSNSLLNANVGANVRL